MKNKEIEELIEEGLRTPPSFQLKVDFKDSVVKVIKKKEQRSQRKLYGFMLFGVLVMLAAGYLVMNRFSDLALFGSAGKVVPFAVIAGAMVALIQYLDKKLVKDRMFNHPV